MNGSRSGKKKMEIIIYAADGGGSVRVVGHPIFVMYGVCVCVSSH